ncbi:MAG: hypothetical protein HFH74_03730 [Lachnospiraceae bacterium]|jgi:hypothetical protein|nr:hypothetical protein [Lachnospiraceae bacterium]
MQSTINQKLFSEACYKMIGALQGQNGIGTLQEKTIHSVLKYYYAPDSAYHEIKIGSYVADICIDGDIYEVQTRNFNTMRNKLNYFLQNHNVTIIYPVAHTKWISWLDMDTGELTPKRKSPKTGTFYQIIPELYKIKMFVNNPRLHFIISLIDVEETRYLNGWSHDKKRGSSRMDGIPVEIYDEVRIDTFADYRIFLPDTLPEQFTSKDLGKVAKIPQNKASTLLNILLETKVIHRIGKSGKSYLYQKTTAPF